MTAITTTPAAPLQVLLPQFLCFVVNDTLNNAGTPVGPDLGKVERDLKKRNEELGQQVQELTQKLSASTQQNLQKERLLYALHNKLRRVEKELAEVKASLNLTGGDGDTDIVGTIGKMKDASNACNANLSETKEQLDQIADDFNQTQVKLNDTAKILNEVETKLETTKDKLNNTEHKLKETAVKLDFTDNVVDALVPNRSLLLTEAVAMGNTSLIIPLIRLGTPVNARDQFGYVALDWASLEGDSAVAKLLLDHKANPNVNLPTYNDFPLHVAARADYSGVVRVLLDADAKKESKNVDGNTALHEAAYYGQENAVKMLLDAGVDVNAKNSEGFTPLLFAAEQGHLPVVKLLVNKGADVTIKNPDGKTAQEEAERRGKQNVEMWLKEWKKSHGIRK